MLLLLLLSLSLSLSLSSSPLLALLAPPLLLLGRCHFSRVRACSQAVCKVLCRCVRSI